MKAAAFNWVSGELRRVQSRLTALEKSLSEQQPQRQQDAVGTTPQDLPQGQQASQLQQRMCLFVGGQDELVRVASDLGASQSWLQQAQQQQQLQRQQPCAGGAETKLCEWRGPHWRDDMHKAAKAPFGATASGVSRDEGRSEQMGAEVSTAVVQALELRINSDMTTVRGDITAVEAKLEESTATLANDMKEAFTRIAGLHGVLGEHKCGFHRRMDDLKSDVDGLGEQCASIEHDIRGMQAHRASEQGLSTQVASLRAEMLDGANSLREHRRDFESLGDEVDGLHGQCASMQNGLDLLANECASMEGTLAELEESMLQYGLPKGMGSARRGHRSHGSG